MVLYSRSLRFGGEEVGTVANHIKDIIKAKGLKQGYVAEMCGYEYKAFNNMLNGRKTIYADDIVKLSKALSVTPNDLFRQNKSQ